MAHFGLLFSFQDKFHHSEEIIRRGYLNAVVAIEQQHFYEVVFYSYEEIQYEILSGYIIAEPGMIIISELKKEIMLESVKDLYENSIFFNGLKDYPIDKYKDYKDTDF